MGSARSRSIPEATVSRLPLYHRVLLEIAEDEPTVSSAKLAELSGVNAAKVRKDLSYLGTIGTRGVGYDTLKLIYRIAQELGLTQDWEVALVGFGNLGHALANYRGFPERGFKVAAIFDSDPSKVGEEVGEARVYHIDDLGKVVRRHQISIAIVATPASSAQEVADRIVKAGIRSILNFAPVVINVPRDVWIRKVDLSMELQILSFYQQRMRALEAAREATGRR